MRVRDLATLMILCSALAVSAIASGAGGAPLRTGRPFATTSRITDDSAGDANADDDDDRNPEDEVKTTASQGTARTHDRGSARTHTTPAMVTAILAQASDVRLKAVQAFGPEGTALLVKFAFDAKLPMQTRWRAVTTMGRVDAEKFRRPLEQALRSPEWFMRNAALIAILNSSREDAIERSRAALNDPALVVRTQGVRNLIALNDRAAEPTLWQELYSPKNFAGKQSLWIRGHIVEALAKFAHPGETRAFAKILNERDPRLHRWAIDGLERSSGVRLSEKQEPLEIRRQKWLARINSAAI